MSDQKEYKPVPLTKGPKVDYAKLLRGQPAPKDIRVSTGMEDDALAKLGIKGKTEITYKKDENGNLILDSNGKPVTIKTFTPTEVPAYFTHAIMVLNGHEPCYFEGCEQVVEQYNTELEILKKRPGGCRECDKARLQRKFAMMFRNALPPTEANKIAQPSIPPHTVTNMATKQVVHVPRKPVPYATIRREVPPEIKEAFTKHASERKLIVNGQVVPLESVNAENKTDTGATGGSESPSSQ